MAELTLDYSAIADAYRAMNKASQYCDDYAGEISKKITKKLSDLERGSNSKTSNASYFAKKKIDELSKKATIYSSYANKLDNFLNGTDGAKAVDENVSKYIKSSSECFRSTHNMEVSGIAEWFTWLSTTILNSSEFGKWLKQAFSDVCNWLSDVGDAIKYWYKCDGGEYVIKIIAGAILLVAAVLVIIVAWPALIAAIATLAAGFSGVALWGVISTGAALITAIIGVLDGITNTIFNTTALVTNSSDPAWAQRYDSYNSTSEYLEKNRFSSKEMNKFSYGAATAIEITSTVCAVINIADMAKNGVNFFKRMKDGDVFFRKMRFTNMSDKMTWTSLKYGLKNTFTNYKTIMGGLTKNQWSDYVKTYNKVASFASKVSNNSIFKSFKSVSKIVINIQDKGIGQALKKYAVSRTTIIKALNSVFHFA